MSVVPTGLGHKMGGCVSEADRALKGPVGQLSEQEGEAVPAAFE